MYSSKHFNLTFVLILAFNLVAGISLKSQPLRGPAQERSSGGEDFQSALKRASAANKPLVVDVYLNGCPHCEALASIMAEKEVDDFYREHFVLWKTEVNSKEGIAFQVNKGIVPQKMPSLFFFDTEGKLIHYVSPADSGPRQEYIASVVAIGKTALDPERRTESYERRFKKGDRSIPFLMEYAEYARITRDSAGQDEASDALGKTVVNPQDIISQQGLYILSSLINDYDNPLAQYFFNHLDDFKAKYPAAELIKTSDGILYRSLYGKKGDSYSAATIEQMRKYMIALGVPEEDASARVILKELDACIRAKDTRAATAQFNEYRKRAKSMGLTDYAYLIKYFNEKATDDSYLPEVSGWAEEGIRLAKPEELNSKAMAGLYYEVAEAYRKMGRKEDALNNAKKGLDVARKAKEEIKMYENQVTRME